jgi:hypothetical protein
MHYTGKELIHHLELKGGEEYIFTGMVLMFSFIVLPVQFAHQ